MKLSESDKLVLSSLLADAIYIREEFCRIQRISLFSDRELLQLEDLRMRIGQELCKHTHVDLKTVPDNPKTYPVCEDCGKEL